MRRPISGQNVQFECKQTFMAASLCDRHQKLGHVALQDGTKTSSTARSHSPMHAVKHTAKRTGHFLIRRIGPVKDRQAQAPTGSGGPSPVFANPSKMKSPSMDKSFDKATRQELEAQGGNGQKRSSGTMTRSETASDRTTHGKATKGQAMKDQAMHHPKDPDSSSSAINASHLKTHQSARPKRSDKSQSNLNMSLSFSPRGVGNVASQSTAKPTHSAEHCKSGDGRLSRVKNGCQTPPHTANASPGKTQKLSQPQAKGLVSVLDSSKSSKSTDVVIPSSSSVEELNGSAIPQQRGALTKSPAESVFQKRVGQQDVANPKSSTPRASRQTASVKANSTNDSRPQHVPEPDAKRQRKQSSRTITANELGSPMRQSSNRNTVESAPIFDDSPLRSRGHRGRHLRSRKETPPAPRTKISMVNKVKSAATITYEERRRAAMLRFDSKRFEAMIYRQSSMRPPASTSPTNGTQPDAPAPPRSEDPRLYLPVNPAIHRVHNRSDEWHKEKELEISRRPRRKYWFGKVAARERWLRKLEERRAEAAKSGRKLSRPEPRPWTYDRIMDFGDVPESQLPIEVLGNAAWVKACSWHRENQAKGIQRRRAVLLASQQVQEQYLHAVKGAQTKKRRREEISGS